MSHEEELAWGEREADARMRDLMVRSREGLIAAQDNAEARRKAAGLSRNRAAELVSYATRRRRQAAQQEQQRP